MAKIFHLLLFLLLFLITRTRAVPMVKLPWSFASKICLPMTDPSYDPFGNYTHDDVSEELRPGSFGAETLYCKRGCCGDNRNPKCCDPSDDVDKGQFETYKLICIIVAGVGGITIIGAITLMMVKMHLKKRRLIRDIQAINKMNNMKSLAPSKPEKQTKEKKEKTKKNKKSKVIKVESQPQILAPIKQSPLDLKPIGSLPAPPPAIYDHISPMASQPASNDPPTSSKPPAYTNLNISNFMDSSPTDPVGQLPIFLPASLEPKPAPMTTPKPEAAKPSIFSTQLAGNPTIYSGPLASETQSGNFSSDSSSTQSNMPGSPLPFDDEDLLLWFSGSAKP